MVVKLTSLFSYGEHMFCLEDQLIGSKLLSEMRNKICRYKFDKDPYMRYMRLQYKITSDCELLVFV